MKRLTGTSKRILNITLAAVACMLVLAFGLTSTGVLEIPFLNAVIAKVFVPVQNAVSGGVRSAQEAFQQRKTQMELTREIDVLTEENKLLQASLAQYSELELENERLHALLGVQQTMPDERFIAANVTGKEPGGWFETFVLGVGSHNGVSKNDPVMGSDGLVGRVTEVNDDTCVVMSIIDSRSAVAGLVERTRDNGVVRGSLYLTESSELLQMLYLPDNAELTSGDRVITSGLDGMYPKGLFIGTVRSISRDAQNEGRYVVMETATDFAHLEDVLVMLRGGESD